MAKLILRYFKIAKLGDKVQTNAIVDELRDILRGRPAPIPNPRRFDTGHKEFLQPLGMKKEFLVPIIVGVGHIESTRKMKVLL